MTNKTNLVIYPKFMELIYYSNDIVRKYPKSEQFALVKEIKSSLYSGYLINTNTFLSYIVPRFISTSFACIEEKGTHMAVAKLEQYMRIFKRNYGDFWILKCDIKKFFYNIDPYILLDIMKKYINDKKLINFTKLLIFSKREPDEKVGIPIVNYTSQYFANIYLNELDQYVKRTLKLKYFVRYMDDFIILLKTKKECIETKKLISDFLAKKLRLELNNKSRYYPYKMGVDFCGYRTFVTHRLLRKSSKKKIIKKVKYWNFLNNHNSLDYNFCMQSLNSWLGHVSHCNSYHLVQKIFNKCNFLYNNTYFDKLESDLANDLENHKLENNIDNNLANYKSENNLKSDFENRKK